MITNKNEVNGCKVLLYCSKIFVLKWTQILHYIGSLHAHYKYKQWRGSHLSNRKLKNKLGQKFVRFSEFFSPNQNEKHSQHTQTKCRNSVLFQNDSANLTTQIFGRNMRYWKIFRRKGRDFNLRYATKWEQYQYANLLVKRRKIYDFYQLDLVRFVWIMSRKYSPFSA